MHTFIVVMQHTTQIVTLDGMEVLQIRMMAIHLKYAAKTNCSMGVHPRQVRGTVAYWFDRFGHTGVGPRASWKKLHAEWVSVFGAVLEDEDKKADETLN